MYLSVGGWGGNFTFFMKNYAVKHYAVPFLPCLSTNVGKARADG